MEKKKREKEAEKAYLEKLRLQVQKDKEERLAKMQKRTEGQDTAAAHQEAANAAATAAAPAPAAAKKATDYTECLLQIRLPNGQALKETFKPTCAFQHFPVPPLLEHPSHFLSILLFVSFASS